MDKYRDITRLPLVESRINHLLGRLSLNRASGSYQTQEELTRDYASICTSILKGFEERVYTLPRAVKGTPLSESGVNLFLLGIYSEILYLLNAVKGTAEMAEENFNFATSFVRKLQADLKHCRQTLSTYALYATQFDNALHFGETFSSEENIDRGSDFLSEEECFIDLAEGTISLPRLEEEDQWIIKAIETGARSNGVIGNNTEAGTPVRGSIKAMHDGNTDTWTEYERVVAREDIDGLQWELKIVLDDVQPVNGIKVHPVFLGARTPPVVDSIHTSSDGKQWIDLKGDIRVADFLDEDQEYRYHLAPHSSRFAGEFNITFAPRFVKFIRILIRQTSAFPITDVYGMKKFRYAIGVREIVVYGHKYASVGELISKQIPFSEVITAVGLQSLVDPPLVPPEVGTAEYFLSFDDGGSWEQVTTLEEASLDIPEVLYPPDGTESFRYKLHLTKDELAFVQKTSKLEARPFREVFSWTARRPFTLNLFHEPIDGTISVCDPEVATRGRVYPKMELGRGVNSSDQIESGTTYRRHGNTQHRVKLPLLKIEDPSSLSVFVNGIRWTRVQNVSSLGSLRSTMYVLERDSSDEYWEIVFGNADAESPLGVIPSPLDRISFQLSEEDAVVEGLVPPYTLKLDYTSDGEKDNTTVRSYGGSYQAKPETMPSGVTKFDLAYRNILIGVARRGKTRHLGIGMRDSSGFRSNADTSNLSPPASGSFQTFQSFVDGNTEISSSGDWTVDAKNGIIYSNSATEEDVEYTVNYWWEDVIDLDSSEWDFVEGKLDEIQIYESGYHTQDATYTVLFGDVGKKSITLTIQTDQTKGIVTKSVRVALGILGNYQPFEVPFIDGRAEFKGRARIQDETIPEAVADASSIASFRLTHWETLVTTSSPFFDDSGTYFQEEKANYASISAEGDFFFDADGDESAGAGYIYVKLSAVGATLPSGLTVSYQYEDELEAERMRGAYSVDGVEGIIHFAEAIDAGASDKSITYRYAPYKVRYNISQQLRDGTDYEYDSGGNLIRVLSQAKGARERYLAVNYKYQPEEMRTTDLAPYYSPLVRALDVRAT